jgi:hypothetical protein
MPWDLLFSFQRFERYRSEVIHIGRDVEDIRGGVVLVFRANGSKTKNTLWLNVLELSLEDKNRS